MIILFYFFYLCLYFNLQNRSNNGQEVADNDQQIPAIQELLLVILTHFTPVGLLQVSGEPLKDTPVQVKSLNLARQIPTSSISRNHLVKSQYKAFRKGGGQNLESDWANLLSLICYYQLARGFQLLHGGRVFQPLPKPVESAE